MSPKSNRILHLEDDPSWRREVQIVLNEDYEIKSARSLKEAVELFREVDFDLVIVDIDLLSGVGEDEEGFRLIDGLQAAGILPGSRIIVLSAYSDSDMRTRRAFRNYGVWDVIPKDRFDAEELKQDVTQALQSPQYSAEYEVRNKENEELVD